MAKKMFDLKVGRKTLTITAAEGAESSLEILAEIRKALRKGNRSPSAAAAIAVAAMHEHLT